MYSSNMFGLGMREAGELLKSTLIVCLVFTIASHPGTDPLTIALVFAVSFVAAGFGFFLHELMHKFTAQRYGYFAFAGWILLSPGAVYISSYGRQISRKANGLISLAGPATNLALALAFYAATLSDSRILALTGSFGYRINIYLAIFNTLPVPSFDGQKIMDWNKAVYAGFCLVLAAVFLVL
jgi:Zn-dependent protease